MNKYTAYLPENVTLVTHRSKFGHGYSDAIVKTDTYSAEFPIFDGMDQLNTEIFEIIRLCEKARGHVSIAFTYGEADRVSLTVNGRASLNYSTLYNSIITPSMALKLCGLTRREVRKFVSRAGKRLRTDFSTLRFARNGVRIDASDSSLLQSVTLKVVKRNKNNKI